MDFSQLTTAEDASGLVAQIETFLRHNVTPAVHRVERESGSEFSPSVHRAMGEMGWVLPRKPISEGGAGLDRRQARILELMIENAGVPMMTLNTTRHLTPIIERWGHPELVRDLIPRIAAGSAALSMGLTEPDGGSDVAAARTKARKVEDHWVIDGYKPFVTSAHNAQYCFLVTRSDPTAAKHRGLSIFLVPLSLPGIEIQPVKWLSGERANGVFFADVEVPDLYLLGQPGEGWRVLNDLLNTEHGEGSVDDGLEDGSFGEVYLRRLYRVLAHALHHAAQLRGQDGQPWLDQAAVQARIGRMFVDMEAAGAIRGMLGRVHAADVAMQVSSELLDLLGTPALIDDGADGAVANGLLPFGYFWAQGQAIGGGTVEIVRNLIAHKMLELPRPYFPPAP